MTSSEHTEKRNRRTSKTSKKEGTRPPVDFAPIDKGARKAPARNPSPDRGPSRQNSKVSLD